jgi:hypothetical protein
MISLEQHNIKRWKYYKEQELIRYRSRANGIACPACGSELRDTRGNVHLTSIPPKIRVECGTCTFTGTRLM